VRRPSSSPAIVPYEEERPDIVRVMRALYSPEAEAGYAELRLSGHALGHPEGMKMGGSARRGRSPGVH
jgi:hypothetical protein